MKTKKYFSLVIVACLTFVSTIIPVASADFSEVNSGENWSNVNSGAAGTAGSNWSDVNSGGNWGDVNSGAAGGGSNWSDVNSGGNWGNVNSGATGGGSNWSDVNSGGNWGDVNSGAAGGGSNWSDVNSGGNWGDVNSGATGGSNWSDVNSGGNWGEVNSGSNGGSNWSEVNSGGNWGEINSGGIDGNWGEVNSGDNWGPVTSGPGATPNPGPAPKGKYRYFWKPGKWFTLDHEFVVGKDFLVYIVTKDQQGNVRRAFEIGEPVVFELNAINITDVTQEIVFDHKPTYTVDIRKGNRIFKTLQKEPNYEIYNLDPGKTLRIRATWDGTNYRGGNVTEDGTFNIHAKITPTWKHRMPDPKPTIITLYPEGQVPVIQDGISGSVGAHIGIDTDSVYYLPNACKQKIIELYRPINFKNTKGTTECDLLIKNYFNGAEALIVRNTNIFKNKKPFKGTLTQPIKVRFDKLYGLPLPDYYVLEPYFTQFGSLGEEFDRKYTLRLPITQKTMFESRDMRNFRIMAWNFITNTWETIGDELDIHEGVASVNLRKSTIIALVDVTRPADYERFGGFAKVSTNDPYFYDTSGHELELYINKLQDLGIIEGYTDGSFHPDKPITRAEWTKMIVRLFHNSDYTYEGNYSYADVNPKQWYAKPILEAKELGIVRAYPDNLFRPNSLVNRAEALAIVLRATRLELGHVIPSFPDVRTNDWFSRYVSFAKKMGIVHGYGDGLFHPEKAITRGEAAKIAILARNNLMAKTQ